MGLQWGSNGGKQAKIIQAICGFFSVFYCFLGFYGVYIIPKLLIRSPDLIQYFSDDFGRFNIFVKIWARRLPNYYQNTSTNKRNMESSLTNIIFISENLEICCFSKFSKGTCTCVICIFEEIVSISFLYYILWR